MLLVGDVDDAGRADDRAVGGGNLPAVGRVLVDLGHVRMAADLYRDGVLRDGDVVPGELADDVCLGGALARLDAAHVGDDQAGLVVGPDTAAGGEVGAVAVVTD